MQNSPGVCLFAEVDDEVHHVLNSGVRFQNRHLVGTAEANTVPSLKLNLINLLTGLHTVDCTQWTSDVLFNPVSPNHEACVTSNCRVLTEGTKILVRINLWWHRDYIMTMSMSGAVKTCVTHDSAASESDVITALREALREKKQELPRALCLKNSQFVSLHSLTRPRLPFWGLSPVSCLFLPCCSIESENPTSHRHSPHSQGVSLQD